MDDYRESWEKFLNPEKLRGNLIEIGLFIAAFEMFKDRIIEKPEIFFSDGFDANGQILGEEYKKEVLSRAKNKFQASLLWLHELGAINQSDLDTIDSIRQHRNELTHEMVSFLTDSRKSLDVSYFQSLVSLLGKIESYWFEHFELGINPEILPEGADLKDVVPGPVWSIQLMLDIALGKEPEEGYYFNKFTQKRT